MIVCIPTFSPYAPIVNDKISDQHVNYKELYDFVLTQLNIWYLKIRVFISFSITLICCHVDICPLTNLFYKQPAFFHDTRILTLFEDVPLFINSHHAGILACYLHFVTPSSFYKDWSIILSLAEKGHQGNYFGSIEDSFLDARKIGKKCSNKCLMHWLHFSSSSIRLNISFLRPSNLLKTAIILFECHRGLSANYLNVSIIIFSILINLYQ